MRVGGLSCCGGGRGSEGVVGGEGEGAPQISESGSE